MKILNKLFKLSNKKLEKEPSTWLNGGKVQELIEANDKQLEKERGYWLNGGKILDVKPVAMDASYKKETRAGKTVTIDGVDYLITSHRLSSNSKGELIISAKVILNPCAS